MNSFIGWIGGKKLLRKEIISMFPEKYDRYIEVFGGAGWVLFGKDYNCKQLEVFNDVNSDLINLYRCIKYHSEELERELEWVLQSRKLFFDYRSQLDSVGLTDIQRAARFFYTIRYSFCSDRKSFATNSKDIINSIALFKEIKQRLNRVVIENKDFENLIKVYDRSNALFYLDPPYVDTEKYYDSNFTKEDHIRLRDTLINIKGKFILSYNDCKFIRDLYKDFKIQGTLRHNCMSNKDNPVFKEVIIRNY